MAWFDSRQNHLVLALALGAALCTPAQAAQRVALLIGNASYRFEKPLESPADDADLLGRVLRESLCFSDVRVERNLDVGGMDRASDGFVNPRPWCLGSCGGRFGRFAP